MACEIDAAAGVGIKPQASAGGAAEIEQIANLEQLNATHTQLTLPEFFELARHTIGIAASAVPDPQLRELFGLIDASGRYAALVHLALVHLALVHLIDASGSGAISARDVRDFLDPDPDTVRDRRRQRAQLTNARPLN
eukprot:COSAG01_NODE_19103_length_1030_cov_24.420726_2_plen_138_part_00